MLTPRKALELARKISANCQEWNSAYSLSHTQSANHRCINNTSIREFIKSIVGLFIRPRAFSRSLMVFQGSRYLQYAEVFPPSQVALIGGPVERVHAQRYGYQFFFSFPIVSAASLGIYKQLNWALVWQVFMWHYFLRKHEKVTVFLQEDTQQIGAFFVALTDDLGGNFNSVCIQHGYFDPSQRARFDGLRSKYNLCWDDSQRRVIGLTPEKSFLIGPPVNAAAKINSILEVILVGIGEPLETDVYERSLKIFNRISLGFLALGVPVQYRPHPNESLDLKLCERLKGLFGELDLTRKQDLLDGRLRLFIGNISSLLYEARLAGHLTAKFSLRTPLEGPTSDFTINAENLDEFFAWVEFNMSNYAFSSCPPADLAQITPADRFREALLQSELFLASDFI